ncbi:hypothetical protein MTO96_023460 [Rhipicephalus appendiculatus]
MFSNQSEDDTTKVDTLPSLYIPEISVPGVTRPSEQPRLHTANASATTPQDPHNAPTPVRPDYDCSTCPCRSLAQRIREKVDYNVDPCQDFYKFVCNSFRGHSEFENVKDSIRLFSQLRLTVPYIPESNQLSWQKAAGMYHACLNFVSKHEPETKYLVQWLASLNLDIFSRGRLSEVNPVEMMVRGSLELGVRALISISFNPKEFRDNKRIMQLEYARDQFFWRYFKRDLKQYTELLLMWGSHPAIAEKMARKIKEYDDEVDYFEYTTYSERGLQPIRLNDLVNVTGPYITSEEWSAFISLYTNYTYTASDYIYYREAALRILMKIYKHMGLVKLRYLIAWKFYSHLVRFTDPYFFLNDRPAEEACYEHVSDVMGLAVISPYLQSEIQPHVVGKADNMVKEIRGAYLRALKNSTWLSTNFREAATKKIMDMVSYVGSPGQRLDPEYVEELYTPYPDAPPDLDVLFPTWIQALGLYAQYMWIDTTTPRCTTKLFTSLIIRVPATISLYRQHPCFSHSYDQDDVMKEYTKRALCLRKSRKSVLSLSGQEETLSEEVDGENLADLVGTKMAYDAFEYLLSEQRDQNLAGINMSVQQLFFFNHCAKWCSEDSSKEPPNVPPRARCIVPLMNMREFSSAYGCAARTPMNPPEKCTFW